MNKQEALTRLDAIEKEQKALREIIEAPDKPLIIFERCLSYEDAAAIKGEDPIHSLPHMDPQTPKQHQINAFHKLLTIGEVLNEGNTKHIYTPYFNISGGGFSFEDVYWGAFGDFRNAAAGLCVHNGKTAEFFGKHEGFLPIWKAYHGR